jgi:3-hydroxyisobutyrate dehydrogenase-like beta-hydroxyacid dehydrogenase
MHEGLPARIAMVGFGEAGRAFASGWGQAVSGRLAAYDIRAAELAEAASALGLVCHDTPDPALEGAEAAFCLVTADQALAAAEAVAPVVPSGLLWFDGNSCAPGTKRRAAGVIEAAGGRYVDLAIMAPVQPRRHRAPTLLAGPHAEAAKTVLDALGMDATIAGTAVGDASSIKMVRSVMMKGLEALMAECLLAARRAGVEDAVLASLEASDPDIEWAARGAYSLERMMVHGRRRAAEMREVALTLRELGLPDRIASATADWQQQVGDLGLSGGPDDLDDRLERILGRLSAAMAR